MRVSCESLYLLYLLQYGDNQLSVMEHAWNPSIWEVEAGDSGVKCQSWLCEILFQKNNERLGMVVYALSPSTWEAVGGKGRQEDF